MRTPRIAAISTRGNGKRLAPMDHHVYVVIMLCACRSCSSMMLASSRRGVSRVNARRSAPFLAHEPFQDGHALLAVFDVVLPQPDLGACGGCLPAPRERAAQGIALDVPRALPQPREGDGVQRAVRPEMLRPVCVIGDH